MLCRDEKLAERLRLLRNQGFQEPRFVHEVVAFNYRLTNIQAAIGVAQTELIEEKIARKRWIGQTYNELLTGTPDLVLPYEEPWAKNVYWMYGILLEESFGVAKDDLMKKLKEKGVDTRSFFCPMSLQPVFHGSNPSLSRRSRKLSSLGGSLEPRSLPSFRSRPDSTANGRGGREAAGMQGVRKCYRLLIGKIGSKKHENSLICHSRRIRGNRRTGFFAESFRSRVPDGNELP